MQEIIFSMLVIAMMFVSAYYLYTTYYVHDGQALYQLQRDYEKAYVQIVAGEGKVCSPGEISFAVYVKWDDKQKKFVKMCVDPTIGSEGNIREVNNEVVIVPSG